MPVAVRVSWWQWRSTQYSAVEGSCGTLWDLFYAQGAILIEERSLSGQGAPRAGSSKSPPPGRSASPNQPNCTLEVQEG